MRKVSLVTNFDQLSTTCSQPYINAVWSTIRGVIVTKSDSNLASFLKNYFKGCYHNNVPRSLTGPLTDQFESNNPVFSNIDDDFERRMQRALVAAISDKFVDEVNAAGGVIELGRKMEGYVDPETLVAWPLECSRRDEMMRIMRVLLKVTSDGRKITGTFGDELYSRFKTLIVDQGAALKMFGIGPDAHHPWLGVFQASVWRAMRMVKNYSAGNGGDAFVNKAVRTQYADDIYAWGSYLQTHRDLIVYHGLLLTEGTSFAHGDYFIDPIYGDTHELGTDQLQAKVIKRILDLMPTAVAQQIRSVTQKEAGGNVCYTDGNVNRCAAFSGLPGGGCPLDC